MKILLSLLALLLSACLESRPSSTTGIEKARAVVRVQSSGLTIEQENVKRRIEMENSPGSIKHLYVISTFSGDVILYSTVKGKVTSSGKRLTPYEVAVQRGTSADGFAVDFNGSVQYTGEVLQDDGTYGSSIEYLYWWDTQGRYHQHYVSGGQIVHISDVALNVRKVIINSSNADQP